MTKTLLDRVYGSSLSLLTDLYELTMAYAYWKNGLENRRAVFQLFFRKPPFGGEYAICAGIEPALEFIERFQFTDGDLSYLSSLKDREGGLLFEQAFLDHLVDFKMEVNVDGITEGTPVFPNEPILRVEGPIIQAQILESVLLNIINFQTLIATKASRVCHAAQGDHVVEFGLRRAQGIDGALSASRAALIGGCQSTSNVLAGKLFDATVLGTHAHSWVMTFDDEVESFRAFGKALPKNCIFLIDTYETIRGVEKAIKVGKELETEGSELIAVRLDSGDLEKLSKQVRQKLDEAGLTKTQIMATNELTEQRIQKLKAQGAPISLWGVGTNLVTAKDQPALDGVYKLTAITEEDGEWKYRLKVSDDFIKTTHPGMTQVARFFDGDRFVADVIFDEKLGMGKTAVRLSGTEELLEIDPSWERSDLLSPLIVGGKVVAKPVSVATLRKRVIKQLGLFPPKMRSLDAPDPYWRGIESRLNEKKREMIEEIASR